MRNSDVIFVGWDHSHVEIPVLIVGRKSAGEFVDIINQFKGDEAKALYERLVTKKGS